MSVCQQVARQVEQLKGKESLPFTFMAAPLRSGCHPLVHFGLRGCSSQAACSLDCCIHVSLFQNALTSSQELTIQAALFPHILEMLLAMPALSPCSVDSMESYANHP